MAPMPPSAILRRSLNWYVSWNSNCSPADFAGMVLVRIMTGRAELSSRGSVVVRILSSVGGAGLNFVHRVFTDGHIVIHRAGLGRKWDEDLVTSASVRTSRHAPAAWHRFRHHGRSQALMRSIIAVTALAFASLPAAAQDNERANTLRLTTKLKSNKVEFSATVKMPDDCALDVYLKREHEMLLYGKVECRIQPTSVQTPDKITCLVQKGKFSGAMQAGGPGFYRLEVMYSRFSQRSMEVMKALGNSYMDWGRDFPLALLDGAIVEQLTKEREECLSVVSSLVKLRDMVSEMIKIADRAKRDFKSIDRELKIVEKKLSTIRDKSLYSATLGVAADVAARIRAMSPSNPKVELPPGVD